MNCLGKRFRGLVRNPESIRFRQTDSWKGKRRERKEGCISVFELENPEKIKTLLHGDIRIGEQQ